MARGLVQPRRSAFLPRRVVLECQIPSSGCASRPASWEAARGYAREPAANVNGLTFRRISDPGFAPNPKSPVASFDDFVGGGDQRRRNGEAEGFGGLQIDDQLETRLLLDRQLAGLGAFQDLVRWKPSFVMPGLVPGIHVLTASQQAKTSRSILLFEHDLRANASRLSRGKTGTHPRIKSEGMLFRIMLQRLRNR